MTLEEQVEKTQREIAALQGHVHDLRIRRREQLARAGQTQLSLLIAEGNADQFVKNAAQMARGAMRLLRQLIKTDAQQLGGGHLVQIIAQAFSRIHTAPNLPLVLL